MTETRRQALKMLGAISATCAFPFAGDELYGQHVHVVTLARAPDLQPYTPAFFTPAEYATLSRLTDVIIGGTALPSAWNMLDDTKTTPEAMKLQATMCR